MYFDCDFPQWMHYGSVVYGFTILGLFFNFYYQAYVRPHKGVKVTLGCHSIALFHFS